MVDAAISVNIHHPQRSIADKKTSLIPRQRGISRRDPRAKADSEHVADAGHGGVESNMKGIETDGLFTSKPISGKDRYTNRDRKMNSHRMPKLGC